MNSLPFSPANCVLCAQLAGPKIALHFAHLFVPMYISVSPTYHVRSSYVTYIVAMRPYFSRLWQFRQLLCVTTMCTLAQLRV